MLTLRESAAKQAVAHTKGIAMMHQKRVKHFDIPGHAHFLTFSCYQRLPLLNKDRTREWFIQSLNAARTRWEFDLWAWVVMPEHVHLLIRPRRSDYRVSSILAGIKKPVGSLAIQYVRESAPKFLVKLRVVNRNRTYQHFWQPGPGQDHNVWEPETIHKIIEYIHLNPVRRGLVTRAEDWLWSSAIDWAGGESRLIRVDRNVPRLIV
jgi:putative transposase